MLKELENYNPQSECIVVDDGSTDDSIALLQKESPTVHIIRKEQNRGFSSAVNAGIREARHELVLLLNNDVAVTSGFLHELQTVFGKAHETFSVAALQKQELADKRVALDGFNTVRWRQGHLELVNVTEEFFQGCQSQLVYCTAGCSLFSREKLLKLGGFCEIFDPFYYEDVELGIQAAKRGWQLFFAPNSVVYHCPASTSRQKRWALRFASVRNYFILHWLTLDSAGLWVSHLLHVAGRLILWSLQGRIRFAVGLTLAILRLPEVVSCRRQRSHGWQYSLKSILSGDE